MRDLRNGSDTVKNMDELPKEVRKKAAQVGMKDPGKDRSASFFHLNEANLFSNVVEKHADEIEVLDIKEALKKYEWLNGYYWRIIEKEKDEYTRKVAKDEMGGYFIRIRAGKKVTFPIQACMFISSKGLSQKVHNIIIAEEGSEAQIITGCSVSEEAGRAEHLGISEFYLKKDSKITFTMIHNWEKDTQVIPRSAALLEENASFASNYVILNPVKYLQTAPLTICRGKNSVARLSSIIYAVGESEIDVGGTVRLEGDGSRAEIIARAIAKDESKIISRGMLSTENPTVKGHLECRGLLMGNHGRIHAIPELSAKGEGSDLSHEAAVGRIAEKEILYLMSRGLTRDEATALIIRGFLDTRILHLPEALENMIETLTEKVAEGM